MPTDEKVINDIKLHYEMARDYLIPEKYRANDPRTLAPSKLSRLSLEKQAKLYAEINEKPLEGWAFFAPAGYSKTTVSWALFKYALWTNIKRAVLTSNSEWTPIGFGGARMRRYLPCYVWHVSVPAWLEQIQASWDDDLVDKPMLSSDKIAKARRDGFVPRVFLEEIDKIKDGSEWATNKLFTLLNEVDKHKGQLVIDSNLSKPQFKGRFGEPIARRIKENCNMREFG